jgi:hypothetical protein
MNSTIEETIIVSYVHIIGSEYLIRKYYLPDKIITINNTIRYMIDNFFKCLITEQHFLLK